MTRIAGSSPELPAAAGPYSPSVRCGPWVYTAGQGGAARDAELVPDVATQTAQCLDNVFAALAASGASEADIAKVTVYLTDREHFDAMNGVYATRFTAPYPARTTVFVGLGADMLVEIDAVAYAPEQR